MKTADNNSKSNLYDILGVNKDASDQELKEAYRKKGKEYHPDKQGGDNRKMQEIVHAYEVLKDATKRKRYDETGREYDQPFDMKFNAFIQDTFIKAVVQGVSDVEHIDLLEIYNEYIDRLLQQEDGKLKVLEKNLEKFHKVKDRLKSETDSRLTFVLEANINEVNKQISALNSDISFIKDCREIINHYEYRFDEESGLLEWRGFQTA